jgi:predicted O-methyltransferase YrrM
MLEYGSGYSTAWFGQRVAKLVSVENDPVWFSRVKEDIEKHALRNVELHLLNQGPILEGTKIGAEYLSVLRQYPAGSFDIVLNDGWARAYVGTRTDLVRPGGLFIWDDYAGAFPIKTRIPGALPETAPMRDTKLLTFIDCTADWRRHVYDDGVHSTAIFVRPA